MKRDYNQIAPWTAAQTLVDSTGIIRQSELEVFDELRDAADKNEMAGHGDTELSGIVEGLEQSLNARFEAGELVEMGSLDFSRDANGHPLVHRGSLWIGLN